MNSVVMLKRKQVVWKVVKMFFLSKEIHYLGHIISGEGISVDPEKVMAIMDWQVPKNAHEVRSFMGLASIIEGLWKGSQRFQNPSLPCNARELGMSGQMNVTLHSLSLRDY
jgi:hypothetical protein